MSYVNYNQAMYRTGFRPYASTDPFGASQLRGLGQVHPFGPWMLHGELGQVHPFTEGGGWPLHGLGVLDGTVPDQSIVNYTGKWTPTYTLGAEDVIAAVIAALAQDGLLVKNVNSDAGYIQSAVMGMTIELKPFNVQLQIQIATGKGGFGDPNDIISMIRHEVYNVTGQMPLADSIPTVQIPPSPGAAPGAPQATGQPGGAMPGTTYGSATDFTTWLEENAMWIGLGVAGLIILPRLVR